MNCGRAQVGTGLRADAACPTVRGLRALVRRHGWVRLVLIAVACSPVLCIVLFHAAVLCLPYPHHGPPLPASSLVVDRDGSPLGAYASPDGQWCLPLQKQEVSTHLMHAVVAVEDTRFYSHSGVDWKSAASAVWENARSLRFRRGASTITMQLYRLRAGTPRSLLGKLEQAIRACQIEQQMAREAGEGMEGKDGILVEYLNRAPFGGNLVGAGAASWRYFGKPCCMLSLGEAALLAGLPQNPNRLRPDRHPEAAQLRRDHVLNRMLVAGMITQQEYIEAAAEPITASWRPLPQNMTVLPAANGLGPTLLNLVWRSSPGTAHPRGQFLRTTIDSAIQRQTAIAARAQLLRLASSGVGAVAVVVLDTPSAECRALVSLGSGRTDLDLTRCKRSTGSTLKPFIYACAFENGLVTPDSIVEDSPKAWSGYQPQNIDHEWRGKMTAAEALAQSRNIPAIVLLSRLGVPYAAGIMQAAGLTSLSDDPASYGVSLAIGGAEVSPLELAQAYATLARGGLFLPAKLKVPGFEDGAESVWLDAARLVAFPPCIADWACWQALDACSTPQRTSRLSSDAARLRVAWKTGTSSGCRDAWCAAVTPSYTVVVWMGNTDGHGADALVGIDAAAPLALQIIASLDQTNSPAPCGPWSASRPAPPAAAADKPCPARNIVTLVSPADRMEIIQSGDDGTSQPVLLQARVNGGDTTENRQSRLWWFIDGELLGSTTDQQQFWWTPVGGAHRITATTAGGHSAAAKVYVR